MSCSFVSFCALNLSEQAAWVQAVGSILAIVVAIIIPMRANFQSNREKILENKRRAKALTILVLPDLYNLRSFVTSFIQEQNGEEPFREVGINGVDLNDLTRSFKALLLNTDQLGEINESLTALVAKVFGANEYYESIFRRQAGGYHNAPMNLMPIVLEEFEAIRELSNSVISKIEEQYNIR